ncbi:MAG: hypothetical protein R3B40_23065 [Polyangiales bacterium]|nr:hypothetical protein [Sandaracinaceae bacterium]
MTGLRLFAIGGIPVWVSPWLLLLGAFLVHEEGVSQGLALTLGLAVSVLVHELGHALVARRYRLSPQILLHGLGGLCAHERAERDRHDALILVAGPLAGLLLGVLVLASSFALQWANVAIGRPAGRVLDFLIEINIGWSLVNLLPMWPLDGGRLFRLGLLQMLRPLWAERVTHALSVALLGGAAVVAFLAQQLMIGFVALYFLHQNLRVLLGEAPGDIVRPKNPRVKAMLAELEAAYASGDDALALRLGHRLREESYLPESVVRKTFAIVGVSTARLGRHAEALPYLQRAEVRADVVEALIECLHMLDRDRELDALLESKAFGLLPQLRREEILSVVRPTTS